MRLMTLCSFSSISSPNENIDLICPEMQKILFSPVRVPLMMQSKFYFLVSLRWFKIFLIYNNIISQSPTSISGYYFLCHPK